MSLGQWAYNNSWENDEVIRHFQSLDMKATLYILGEGFDKRMCNGLSVLNQSNGEPMTLWKIRFKESKNSASDEYKDRVTTNLETYTSLIGNHTSIEHVIEMWTGESDDRYVAELNAAKFIFDHKEDILTFKNIILDISAFPQAIYFPMVTQLCKISNESPINLFIMATEHYVTDMNTLPVELGEKAHQLHGFIGSGESATSKITVWFPILGEVNELALRKYNDFLETRYGKIDEFCPILPFPAEEVNRSDKLIEAYSRLLFSGWNAEKRNILYVSENRPFQVYRKICEVVKHYSDVMEPLGECRFVFSTITGKLMGIGTLLAAIDLKNEGYSIDFLNISNNGYILKDYTQEEIPFRTVCLCLSDDGF